MNRDLQGDRVAGCLARHQEGWINIGAEEWVLAVLREGYRIPFFALPPLTSAPRYFRTYPSGSEKGRALALEVRLLRAKGAIEDAPPTPGFYSHLFVVPKSSGGFRPILDLSVLNRYVHTTKFRMETVRTVLSAIRRDDWMVSLDLRDAYLQVPVHPDSRKFLRFTWEGQLFQFQALCFGLSTAPQVFTRMMAPVSAALHRQGIRLLRYLDDWLLLASSAQDAHLATKSLVALCSTLGIQINWEKSSLTPSQTMTFLGMKIHSRPLKVFPTETRLTNLRLQLESFLSVTSPPAKDWMALLGHMSSLIYLIPGARRRMRSLQLQLTGCWDRHLQGDDFLIPWECSVLQDLQWWSEDQHLRVGQSLQVASPDLFLYTDASTLGWGASLLQESISGLWSTQESSMHINVLELKAIWLGLSHFTGVLQGKTVAVFSDNATALSYLAKEGGTRSTSLNAEAQRILAWAEVHSVTILTQFVKGSSNVLADCLSRRAQIISTEWTLHHEVCSQLWKLWGYPTVDLFATRLNFRLPNFVSPFHDPCAVATDAFLYNWNHQDLYAFPPFPLVRQVLNKLRSAQGTSLILIAPFWPQKEWFPDLIQALVDIPRRLPLRRDLLRQPHFHRFHLGLHALALTAWRLSSDLSVIEATPPELRSSWQDLNALPLL